MNYFRPAKYNFPRVEKVAEPRLVREKIAHKMARLVEDIGIECGYISINDAFDHLNDVNPAFLAYICHLSDTTVTVNAASGKVLDVQTVEGREYSTMIQKGELLTDSFISIERLPEALMVKSKSNKLEQVALPTLLIALVSAVGFYFSRKWKI